MKKSAGWVCLFLAVLAALCLCAGCALGESIPEKIETEPLNAFVARVRRMKRYVSIPAYYSLEKMAAKVKALNKALDARKQKTPVFAYFVESSCSHPAQKEFDADSPAYRYLREHLHADAIDHLKYTTFEQFCQWFYATDPHWNYRGSYQGYLDVLRLLKGREETPLTPAEEVSFPVVFDGSYSVAVQQALSEECFTVYRFDDFPAYETYINGRKKTYGHMRQYLNGVYGSGAFSNHYGQFYGGDEGLIVFRGEKKGKGTLLILGDSMSNPVKTLLMAHYDAIVYVDLRHYEKSMGTRFSLNAALKQYRPDQILLLGSAVLFTGAGNILP